MNEDTGDDTDYFTVKLNIRANRGNKDFKLMLLDKVFEQASKTETEIRWENVVSGKAGGNFVQAESNLYAEVKKYGSAELVPLKASKEQLMQENSQ